MGLIPIQLYNESDHFTTQTNLRGEFSFTNYIIGIYNIRITYPGFIPLDTIVKLDNFTNSTYRLSANTTNKTLYKSLINKESAISDIKNRRVKLYIPGVYASRLITEEDKGFENKYSIEFLSLGCVILENENYEEYNQTIFIYLDKQFGVEWRKVIRQDVIALEK